MINADLIRHPSIEYPTGGAFPDPTTALIDREREMHYTAEGKHLETGFALSLTYRPPSDYQSRATRPLFFSRHGRATSPTGTAHSNISRRPRRSSSKL